MRADDRAVRDFLACSMIARVATLSRKGEPFLTPLWFVSDRGRLYLATGQATVAVRNIRARPDVVLLFEAERAADSGRVLRVRGTARVRGGLPSWRQLLRMGMKYYLAPGAMRSELSHVGQWALRQRLYAQGRAAVIEVVPETAEFLQRPVS